VYVTVNPSGYKKVSVPDVIQVTLRNATAKLRAVGLDVQRVTYIDEFGKDMVYRIKYKGKYIEEGYKLPKTSKVELVCGNGYESEGSKVKSASEE
jgi:beta-lactam-binding protein with PASTA domain